MSDFDTSANADKRRLTEISEKIDCEDVSTDELLEMLDEAVNIGMNVCSKAQENINSQIANEAKAEDERN